MTGWAIDWLINLIPFCSGPPRLPGEWRCALRVLWLVLLCVVLLAILSTVLEQIFIYSKTLSFLPLFPITLTLKIGTF